MPRTSSDHLDCSCRCSVAHFLSVGRDVITDFKAHGDLDKLLAYDADSYTAEQRGDNTLVKFDNGTSVLLLDFDKLDLHQDDIEFL